MPRNGSGSYTLPSGNPVVTGTTIESTWANTTLSDIATTLTDSLSRSGQGGMTAALRIADGTQGAPGLAFANETGSGLYRDGTGEVWAVVQGVQTLNLDASGVTVPAAKATSIEGTFVFNETGADKDARFEGDTDANLLFVDASTDRVGVGTNAPATKMTVRGATQSQEVALRWERATDGAVAGGLGYFYDSENSVAVGSITNHPFKIITNDTTKVTVDTSGNLGIGTSSPVGKVDAVANAYAAFVARASTSGAGQTVDALKATDSATSNFANAKYTANEHIWNYAGASEGMRLNSSGNVGIGTNSPSEKLHVNGATSTYILVSSTNASTGSGIFTSNATNTYLIGAGASSGGSGLEFKDETNAAIRMVLTSGGNLGIGTTTVNAKLHVSGNVAYTIPVNFAGASGNSAWSTGFLSQAVNASILATDSIVGANVYSVSDARLKTNIAPIPRSAGLDFVKAVDPVSFDWKADNSHDTGFIAQSLMSKGYGHLVSAIPDGAMEEVTHEDGNVSPAGARFVVRYDSIVPVLHAAIRDQQALIEMLMARVAALEAQ